MIRLLRLVALGLFVAITVATTGLHHAAPSPARQLAVDAGAQRISSSRVAELRVTSSSTTTTTTSTTTTTTSTTTTTVRSGPASPPRPRPAPVADGDPGTGDPLDRARAALESAVPARLRAHFPVQLEIIAGSTSWSSTDGTIRVSRYHAGGQWSHLRAVIAHEWGHQTAFKEGSHRYLGAPPDGWPYDGPHPEEAWADCVSVSLIGINPSGNAAECQGATIQFVQDWLGAR